MAVLELNIIKTSSIKCCSLHHCIWNNFYFKPHDLIIGKINVQNVRCLYSDRNSHLFDKTNAAETRRSETFIYLRWRISGTQVSGQIYSKQSNATMMFICAIRRFKIQSSGYAFISSAENRKATRVVINKCVFPDPFRRLDVLDECSQTREVGTRKNIGF